jgi:hypothetical protein
MRSNTFDSVLAFYVNQLDNLDKRLYEPMVSYKWGRDIKLRTGITMANESTSFIRSMYASVGGMSAVGKPWISPSTTTIPGITINGERIVTPLRLLGQEISYSSVELERSQLLGQPIDKTKFDALTTIYQMCIDEQVYIGDVTTGSQGLFNSSQVTVVGATADGTGSSALWSTKTPAQILRDVNQAIAAAWAASGFAVCPTKILLPPAKLAYLSSQLISTAGSNSILKFIEDNSIALRENGQKLDIQASKWLTNRGVGGAIDRMCVYTNEENRVRFPMVPVRRETPYYLGIKFNAPYIWAMGDLEIPYPDTIYYLDGI